jgi:hypothetical protein
VEASHWEVNPPDGWGNTPPISPVPEGSGEWPNQEALVDAEVAAWPHFPPSVLAVKVTIETKSSIGDLEEHSTCRSPVLIGCLSVLDLLSLPCHSTISTSVRSCAPHSSCG